MAFPTGWSNKHKITINTTALSLGGSLTNEPVLLRDNQFLAAAYSNSQGKQLSSNYLSSDANLQGYWKLESDGTDTSSNSYTLSGVNTPTHTTGMFGNGTDLEQGSTQAYTIADASCANLEISGSQTWSAWIKPESTPAGFMHIMGKNDGAGGAIHRLCIDSSDFPFFELDGLTTNDKATSTIPVVAGNWYHICGVYNSSESLIKIYVNGHLTTATASGSSTDTNGDFAIGRLGADTTSSNYFDGVIDDCAVFDRALSDEEVRAIFTGGADLRFSSDEAGITQLAHEVVDWDIDNSTAQVWVKGTWSTTTTDIYVWYNNSTVTPQARDLASYGSDAVWSNGYQGVWHLQDGNGRDSSANQNNILAGTFPATPITTGKWGNAMDFESLNSEYLTITDGNQSGLDITGDLTFYQWLNFESLPTSGNVVAISNKLGGSPNDAYGFRFKNNAGTYKLALSVDAEGNSLTEATVDWTPSTSTWYQTVGVYDASGGTADFYVSGSQQGSQQSGLDTSIVNSSSDYRVGAKASGTPSQYLDAALQEVWVLNSTKSADWVAFQYNTQNAPDTYITASPLGFPKAIIY